MIKKKENPMTPAQELTLAMEQVKLMADSSLHTKISFGAVCELYGVEVIRPGTETTWFVKTSKSLDKAIDAAFQECINRSWLK